MDGGFVMCHAFVRSCTTTNFVKPKTLTLMQIFAPTDDHVTRSRPNYAISSCRKIILIVPLRRL